MSDEKQQVVTSKQFTLNWLDGLKGLVMTVLGACLTALEAALEALDGGALAINWKKVAIGGTIAGIAYLLKNFFTKAEVKKPIE